MPIFNYNDGTKQEFEHFTIDPACRIYVGQPAKTPGHYVNNATVYVEKRLFDFDRNYRNGYTKPTTSALNKAIMDNKHVAVTANQLVIGIPEGVYVPIRWNAYNYRFEITTENLENDTLFLCDAIASEETKAKVKSGMAEEDEEDANVSAVPGL